MKVFSLIIISLFIFSCSSHPVLPKADDIKVSREEPGKDCLSLGSIEGRATSMAANAEAALEDLKQEAIKKGANYVKIETIGAQSTAIRGEAFFCK